jgi:hypothetical protein
MDKRDEGVSLVPIKGYTKAPRVSWICLFFFFFKKVTRYRENYYSRCRFRSWLELRWPWMLLCPLQWPSRLCSHMAEWFFRKKKISIQGRPKFCQQVCQIQDLKVLC